MTQTLKQAGYRFVTRPYRGGAIFQERATGTFELYQRRAHGIASWGLNWDGADYEFVSIKWATDYMAGRAKQ